MTLTSTLILALGFCAGPALAQSPEQAPTETAYTAPSPVRESSLADKARELYFSGDTLKAAQAFEAAVKVSSKDWRVWVDGAITWAEAGHPEKAVAWQRRAADLNDGAEARAAVGWALLRADEPKAADAEFTSALASDSKSSFALLGAGRAKLALGDPKKAIELMTRAAEGAPGQSLADFYLGNAYEQAGDAHAATDAYRRAVGADSYFHEGRSSLARSYLHQRRYNDAWSQLKRLLEADPGSKLAHALLKKVRPLIARASEATLEPALDPTSHPLPGPAYETEPWGGRVPSLRVGVSCTQMGRPRARRSVTVRGHGAWKAVDPKKGRVLLTAAPGESWTLRLIPGKRVKKKRIRARLEFRSSNGKVAAVPGDVVLLTPLEPATAAFTVVDASGRGPRSFRGDLELALFGGARTIRVVNIIGLEDYTHGVVSSEMPQRAPFEALKAQAVVARTHALYIKSMTRRHRKEGYALCNEQHCQVYGGIQAETSRTRPVVIATRGRVATWRGKPAHVIYSSHCGGRTQSGSDIGWGAVPYWKSVDDSAAPEPLPASPLDLRLFLSDWPKGFDRPSGYVYPAHARWVRAVPAQALGEKLNRKFHIGQLRGLRVLRRAPSGHVGSLLIIGSKRNKKLGDEMSIRSLLGVGSLRSTMFVIDTEYRKGKKSSRRAPVLEPATFVFRGGGWGHGVGLCQSGAMGRAEAGESYEEIVKAYFLGVEVATLDY